MIGISLTSFIDEFAKIAAVSGKQMTGIRTMLERISGAAGKKAVPKSKPMTAFFRGGKMVKVPHGSPPPLPAGA